MSWAGDPDYIQGSQPQSVSEHRRQMAARRQVMRVLVGSGVIPRENPRGHDWDIEGLPLGGRIKVTAAKSQESRVRLMRWLRGKDERRRWGALAWFNWGQRTGMTVQLNLDDFGLIVGKLAQLMREKERWLDNADTIGSDHRNAG